MTINRRLKVPKTQELFSTWAWMSHLVLDILYNPQKATSNISKRTDLPATSDQTDKKKKFSSSMFLCSIPAESGAQIRSGFSKFKRSGLKLYFPWLKFWTTSWYSHFKLSKSPYMHAIHFFEFLLITDMVNLTIKNNHHIVQPAN